jgi:hypothetical protein
MIGDDKTNWPYAIKKEPPRRGAHNRICRTLWQSLGLEPEPEAQSNAGGSKEIVFLPVARIQF